MITEGSRYEESRVLMTQGADSVYRPTTYYTPSPYAQVRSFRYHIVQEGERIELIAYNTLGDAELWWMVAELNPEILNPSRLVPGTILRVPA